MKLCTGTGCHGDAQEANSIIPTGIISPFMTSMYLMIPRTTSLTIMHVSHNKHNNLKVFLMRFVQKLYILW